MAAGSRGVARKAARQGGKLKRRQRARNKRVKLMKKKAKKGR